VLILKSLVVSDDWFLDFARNKLLARERVYPSVVKQRARSAVKGKGLRSIAWSRVESGAGRVTRRKRKKKQELQERKARNGGAAPSAVNDKRADLEEKTEARGENGRRPGEQGET